MHADILSATILECVIQKFIQSVLQLHLCHGIKKTNQSGPQDYPGPHRAKKWKRPQLALIIN